MAWSRAGVGQAVEQVLVRDPIVVSAAYSAGATARYSSVR